MAGPGKRWPRRAAVSVTPQFVLEPLAARRQVTAREYLAASLVGQEVITGRLYRAAAAAGPSALLTARTRWERGGMRGSIQNALRLFTRVNRRLALRSAGKEGASTSVVRHVGRRSGQMYETPVVAAQHGDSFLIALPYGERTDWLKNVLGKGSAAVVTNGHTYEVERPEVIPMAEATAYFRPRDQRLHRQFQVHSALQVHQRPQAH